MAIDQTTLNPCDNIPIWHIYNDGAEIGQKGSENGIVIKDEECGTFARITLEKAGYSPYAITCGIYGVMVHTAYASDEAEALMKYEGMKADILCALNGNEILSSWCDDFFEKWY